MYNFLGAPAWCFWEFHKNKVILTFSDLSPNLDYEQFSNMEIT